MNPQMQRAGGIRLTPTALPEVLIIEPKVFQDERGYFFECYHQNKFAAAGIAGEFVQDNHSRSVRNTLRGLHYQLAHPQAKLCRVTHGEVFDVALDIRLGSPSFGQWVGVTLSAENKRLMYIPAGFAHGFMVLSEAAEVLYKCTDFYYPEDEFGVLWNDPALKIDWRIAQPLLSAKDQAHSPLAEIPPARLPRYEGADRRLTDERVFG